ncbi:hypothetical protein [Pseudonocardia spinosispora]|uniref:hypothetical protein n=1 Tax=Pseudonocardia spinosispora TaxID=103441 RepID=UPI000421A34B|nr:hypothetical protein [Pseudonocardia spinosispora]
MSVISTQPAAAPVSADSRQFQRQAITEHFLTALEDVVWRYRALSRGGEHADITAEVITAEVAHQLSVARSSLRRHPAIT